MCRGIKKLNTISRTAALLFCLLVFIMLEPLGVYAASTSAVTLSLEQEFFTSHTGLSVSMEYVLTAVEPGNPLPEGSSGDSYTVTMPSDQKTVNITIVYTKSGTYQYELKEKAPTDFPFTWKPQTYHITVQVGQDFTTIITIRNNEGKKVSVMSWSYTDIKDPTPSPKPTPKPTVKPTPGGTVNPNNPSKIPQTGDQSSMTLWVFLGVLSSLGLLCCVYLLHRTRKQGVKKDE